MSVSPEEMNKSKSRSFRRYKDGQSEYRSWQDKIFDAGWSHKCPEYVLSTPPCQGSCPSGHDVRGWLNIVRGIEKAPLGADGKPSMSWQEYAWRRMTEANPFPAIMGRVCPAPCQGGCNRSEVDEFVGINSIEHFVGNWAIEHGLGFAKPTHKTGKRVAIIGGGVGGLSCAYHLMRKGHDCVVFESSDKLGGMISFGLPAYRTPRDIVDAEVQRILDMGVEVRLNTRVGKDVSFADLRRKFDAVFIGIGAQTGNVLDIPGSDAPNCTDGISFLREFNEGKLDHAGKRIVVIGGGDTAMDVAAVARRLGSYNVDAETLGHAKVVVATRESDSRRGLAQCLRSSSEVVIAYRRHVQEMPASKHELDAVIQEGVEIQSCVAPVSVVKDANGNAVALRVIPVDWVNKKMIPKEGSEYNIPCDLIVSAVGQSVNWSGMDEFKNDRGLAKVDKNLQAVGHPGVFVGGDAITPFLLTTAIGHGRIASEGIDHYLKGEDLGKRPKVDVHYWDLLQKQNEFGKTPETYRSRTKEDVIKEEGSAKEIDLGLRGSDTAQFALHNFENRADKYVMPSKDLFLGHFPFTPRNEREMRVIDTANVLGNEEERVVALAEAQAQAEAKRCMSCGLCFECDNCVIYCPQGAVKKTPKAQATTGRYVYTDYAKCIGCHICADVCPTGYIKMGMGD
ncbi:MAG: NAD(P)-binding protein [Sulfuricella sp.]|nr:NAD(P)-binding protein [Sulfuricella sp.]